MKIRQQEQASKRVYDAINSGNHTLLEKSLVRGKSPNVGFGGLSPICHAIWQYCDRGGQRIHLIKLLIERNADINRPSNFLKLGGIVPAERSSLTIIAAVGHPWTPLFYAVFKGVCDVVEILLESGADTTIKCTLISNDGEKFGCISPARLAQLCGYDYMSEILARTHPDENDHSKEESPKGIVSSNEDVEALKAHCETLGVTLDDLIHITEEEMKEIGFALKEKLIVRKLKANLELIKAETNRQQVIHQHNTNHPVHEGTGGKSKAEIASDTAGHAVGAAKLGWNIASQFLN